MEHESKNEIESFQPFEEEEARKENESPNFLIADEHETLYDELEESKDQLATTSLGENKEEDQIGELRREVEELKLQMSELQEQHEYEIDSLLAKIHHSKNSKHNQALALEDSILNGTYYRFTLEGHKGGVYSLDATEMLLVSASGDRTIRVWDSKSGDLIDTLEGHTNGVCCVQLYDENTIISGSWDNSIRIWDLKTQAFRVLSAHVNGVRCLQAKGNRLVSGASDKIIFVWDLQEGRCELLLKGHESGVYCLQFHNNKLISGGGDKTLRIWDLGEGKCVKVLRGHTGDIFCLKFRNNTLISGSADHTLRVWDLDSGDCLRAMLHPDVVYCCDFLESFIVTGCGDNSVRYWDFRSGECLRVFRHHTDAISSMFLMGKKMITGSIDTKIGITTFKENIEEEPE